MEGSPKKEEGYSREELQYMLQAYQERYDALTEQIKRGIQAIEGTGAAQEALADPSKLKKKNALVNAGGGLYIPMLSEGSGTVAIAIGAGIVVEKDSESALRLLKTRLDKQTSALDRLMQERRQIEEIVYDLSYKIGEAVG